MAITRYVTKCLDNRVEQTNIITQTTVCPVDQDLNMDDFAEQIGEGNGKTLVYSVEIGEAIVDTWQETNTLPT